MHTRKFKFSAAILAALWIAGTASAALITNGDLEVQPTSPSGATYDQGNSRWYLGDDDNQYRAPNTGSFIDTGLDANEWGFEPALTRGFQYSTTGGNGGGGGWVNDNPANLNGKARGVAFFANDGKASQGDWTASIDILFNGSGQQIQVQLYGWNTGETAPVLSMGGSTTDFTGWYHTTANDATTVLDTTISASDLGNWQTVDLGTLSLGSGKDRYAWRVGVAGATAGTNFAVDNLTVVPEPATFGLVGLGAAAFLLRRRRG